MVVVRLCGLWCVVCLVVWNVSGGACLVFVCGGCFFFVLCFFGDGFSQFQKCLNKK